MTVSDLPPCMADDPDFMAWLTAEDPDAEMRRQVDELVEKVKSDPSHLPPGETP